MNYDWVVAIVSALDIPKPSDGSPLKVTVEDIIRRAKDLKDERDEARKEARAACIALADAFVPKEERAGAHLQGLSRLVAHAIEHHSWHHDAQDTTYVRYLEERADSLARILECPGSSKSEN